MCFLNWILKFVPVYYCEFSHLLDSGPFGSVMITTKRLPYDGMCGVPKHVGELIVCEEYI